MSGTIGIIQARMASERLPGKILAPLAGRPMLSILAARLDAARVDEWWLATSSDPSDDVTEAWGFELGLRVHRGHPTDVLSRFLAIGRETGAEWLLRVTADNPFLDAALVDALLDARDASGAAKRADAIHFRGGEARGGQARDGELVAGRGAEPSRKRGRAARRSPRLPLGYGVELARRTALERAGREIPPDQPHHRAHVTSWLRVHASDHTVPTPIDWPDRPDWRWTVDTYEDLAMARSAFRTFGAQATTIGYPAMVERLDAQPEIVAMNRHVVQKKLEEG